MVWVVVVVCVVAALGAGGICALCGFGGALGYFAERDAAMNEATAILTDIREDDYAGGRARMCSSYLASHDAAAFQQEVAAHPALADHTSATLHETARDNGRVTLSGDLQAASGSSNVRVMVWHEHGSRWCIDGIALDDGLIGSETAP